MRYDLVLFQYSLHKMSNIGEFDTPYQKEFNSYFVGSTK
ncbi:unnamed protein product, partial [marine sediment metagenome]